MENDIKDINPAGNIESDKGKSTEKIYTVVALIMALDRMIKSEGSRGNMYNNRGLLVF